MAAAQGTVLTCDNDQCGCRVRVEVACDCPDAGAPYVCSCGAAMIEVTGTGSTQSPGDEGT